MKKSRKKIPTILHTIDTTGPGGAETVFIDLATRLPKEKYRSIVVIRGAGWVHEELVRRGVKPIFLDAKGSFNLRYLLALRKIIRDEGVDLVQSHLLGASVYSSLVALLTGVPVVSTFHGVVDIGENERFKRLKFAAINFGARHVVAVTDSLLEDILGRTSLRKSKCSVVYNGIDTQAFMRPSSNSLRTKYRWSDDDVLVGSLGNVRPAKGYDILLRTAALLKDSQYSFRFVIAGQGSGKLFDSLMTLRKEFALEDSVIFLGFVDDAAEFLSNLDVVMSSSISEGLPLSAIQAMSAQRPLLATRCGGYEGLIEDGVDGRLVNINAPDELAAALEELVENKEMSKRLASAALDKAKNKYGVQTMYDAYERLYQRFLK